MNNTTSTGTHANADLVYDPSARCCAYCYKMESPLATCLKTCGRCHRRPYCSRPCQREDWICGHRFWCSQNVGERGIDFSIRPAGTHRGLGLFALRSFAKGDKILVERPALRAPHAVTPVLLEGLATTLARDHPSVQMAVMALGSSHDNDKGDFGEKFLNNRMKISSVESGLFVTLARANHSCHGNSAHFFDDHHGQVEVLVCQNAIETGTEITFSYILDQKAEPSVALLKQHYGFVCDCTACSDPTLQAQLDEMLDLDERIQLQATSSPLQAMDTAHRLLKLYDTVRNCPDTSKARTHFDLFQLYVARRSTLDRALNHVQLAHDWTLRFFGYPQHDLVRHYKYYWDAPEKHPSYLCRD